MIAVKPTQGASSACRSPLLRDQTGGLLKAEWTPSNPGQLHLIISEILKRDRVVLCGFITALKHKMSYNYRDMRKKNNGVRDMELLPAKLSCLEQQIAIIGFL